MTKRSILSYLNVFSFSAITGILATCFVILFKFVAKYVIKFSSCIYVFLRANLIYVIPAVVTLYLLSLLLANIYKKHRYLSGGGIAISVAAHKGIVMFNWLFSLIGVYFLSLLSFFVGVPLGNEGPSVQIGASVGTFLGKFCKREDCKYAIIGGGACAGFSVATGSAVSALTFAFEEAGMSLSTIPVFAVLTSAVFARLTTRVFNILLSVNAALFDKFVFSEYSLKFLWISLVIGVVVGFFSVLFLKYYMLLSRFINKKLSRVATQYKIFAVFLLSLACGVFSFKLISTGHSLTEELMFVKGSFLFLVIVLLIRTTLTLCANISGITGGMFLPLLAIGALLGSLTANTLIEFFNLSNEMYSLCVVLGITCSISGMMRMPLTAIVFTLEALMGFNNILYVVIAVAVCYSITSMFKVKSISHLSIDSFKELMIE